MPTPFLRGHRLALPFRRRALCLLAAAALAAPVVRAQMTIEIFEDGPDLVFHYSGTMGDGWSPVEIYPEYAYGAVGSSVIFHAVFPVTPGPPATAPFEYMNDDVLSGTPLWNDLNLGTVTGDSFWIESSLRGTAAGYAGDTVEGWLSFANQSLFDVGLTLGDTGLITYASGYTVAWSAGASAVPEPGTYAAILGLVVLVGAAVRRRRPGPARTA